jgi:hypothetical protein
LGSTIAAAQKDHIVEPDIPVFQVTIACAVIGGGRRGRESGRGSCGFKRSHGTPPEYFRAAKGLGVVWRVMGLRTRQAGMQRSQPVISSR